MNIAKNEELICNMIKHDRDVDLWITGGIMTVKQPEIDKLLNGYSKELLKGDNYKEILEYELYENGWLLQGKRLNLIR